jgi:hypothetical protein
MGYWGCLCWSTAALARQEALCCLVVCLSVAVVCLLSGCLDWSCVNSLLNSWDVVVHRMQNAAHVSLGWGRHMYRLMNARYICMQHLHDGSLWAHALL